MLEQLSQIDHDLFFFINKGLSNPVFDWLLPHLRNRYFWIPLYLFITVFFIRNYGRKGWLLLIFMGATFGAADYFSASIVKPAVERIRPCNDPAVKTQVNSRVTCGSGFSFPSSHATNHFALALFLIMMFYEKWKPIIPLALLWAFSIGFAQIYVGVHYPGDITFGALLGAMIGYLTSTVLLHLPVFKGWIPGN